MTLTFPPAFLAVFLLPSLSSRFSLPLIPSLSSLASTLSVALPSLSTLALSARCSQSTQVSPISAFHTVIDCLTCSLSPVVLAIVSRPVSLQLFAITTDSLFLSPESVSPSRLALCRPPRSLICFKLTVLAGLGEFSLFHAKVSASLLTRLLSPSYSRPVIPLRPSVAPIFLLTVALACSCTGEHVFDFCGAIRVWQKRKFGVVRNALTSYRCATLSTLSIMLQIKGPTVFIDYVPV
jgi:hypothetical protein